MRVELLLLCQEAEALRSSLNDVLAMLIFYCIFLHYSDASRHLVAHEEEQPWVRQELQRKVQDLGGEVEQA